jgi:hypothetical protein
MRAWKLLHDCDFYSFQLICEDIFFSTHLLDIFREVGTEDNTIVISYSGRMRRRPLMVLLTATGTARTISETAVGTERFGAPLPKTEFFLDRPENHEARHGSRSEKHVLQRMCAGLDISGRDRTLELFNHSP